MPCTISVIIPSRNSAMFLAKCLDALSASAVAPFEIIVVNDASTDETVETANRYNIQLLTTPCQCGPAYARNIGSRQAGGNVLLFLDSDVCVAPDTLARIAKSFNTQPKLDALIGSYDNSPASPDFLSQYRNLMHAYVHGKGLRRASTFWSGCGAIRRDIFLQHSGFSASYDRPAIEDIELGYRLKKAGCRLNLDPAIQVTHLKRWTFWGLLKTDILDRGIPWTELILRDRTMPNDLNLQLSQRVSVALVFLLVSLAAGMAIKHGAYLLLPPFVLLFLMLAGWWSELFLHRRPRRGYAMVAGMFALAIAMAYLCRMYALILPLAISPPILFMRHRYRQRGRTSVFTRPAGIVYICFVLAVATWYLWPSHQLVLASVAVLSTVALLNTHFYVFLAKQRGLVFMLAAIPFHFLYHFYNGVSFLIGLALHLVRGKRREATSPDALMPLIDIVPPAENAEEGFSL